MVCPPSLFLSLSLTSMVLPPTGDSNTTTSSSSPASSSVVPTHESTPTHRKAERNKGAEGKREHDYSDQRQVDHMVELFRKTLDSVMEEHFSKMDQSLQLLLQPVPAGTRWHHVTSNNISIQPNTTQLWISKLICLMKEWICGIFLNFKPVLELFINTDPQTFRRRGEGESTEGGRRDGESENDKYAHIHTHYTLLLCSNFAKSSSFWAVRVWMSILFLSTSWCSSCITGAPSTCNVCASDWVYTGCHGKRNWAVVNNTVHSHDYCWT